MAPNFVGIYSRLCLYKIYNATILISKEWGVGPPGNGPLLPLFFKISNVNFFYWSKFMTPNFVGIYSRPCYSKIYKATIPISKEWGVGPSGMVHFYPYFSKFWYEYIWPYLIVTWSNRLEILQRPSRSLTTHHIQKSAP